MHTTVFPLAIVLHCVGAVVFFVQLPRSDGIVRPPSPPAPHAPPMPPSNPPMPPSSPSLPPVEFDIAAADNQFNVIASLVLVAMSLLLIGMEKAYRDAKEAIERGDRTVGYGWLNCVLRFVPRRLLAAGYEYLAAHSSLDERPVLPAINLQRAALHDGKLRRNLIKRERRRASLQAHLIEAEEAEEMAAEESLAMSSAEESAGSSAQQAEMSAMSAAQRTEQSATQRASAVAAVNLRHIEQLRGKRRAQMRAGNGRFGTPPLAPAGDSAQGGDSGHGRHNHSLTHMPHVGRRHGSVHRGVSFVMPIDASEEDAPEDGGNLAHVYGASQLGAQLLRVQDAVQHGHDQHNLTPRSMAPCPLRAKRGAREDSGAEGREAAAAARRPWGRRTRNGCEQARRIQWEGGRGDRDSV